MAARWLGHYPAGGQQRALWRQPGQHRPEQPGLHLRQIGSEVVSATVKLPSGTTTCANQGGTCTLLANAPARVFCGTGSTKTCRHLAATRRASLNGSCSVPSGNIATIYHSANGRFFARGGSSGSVACNNATFGDSISGTAKACWR